LWLISNHNPTSFQNSRLVVQRKKKRATRPPLPSTGHVSHLIFFELANTLYKSAKVNVYRVHKPHL
jgi:hypothetical protein